MKQALIDQMEFENVGSVCEELLEAECMHIVDDEIEDLQEAQDDLLFSGMNESGTLVDTIDLIEMSIAPAPAKPVVNTPTNSAIYHPPTRTAPPNSGTAVTNNQQNTANNSLLGKTTHNFGNGLAAKRFN